MTRFYLMVTSHLVIITQLMILSSGTVYPDKSKTNVITIKPENLDEVLASNELVLIHFNDPKIIYKNPGLLESIRYVATTLTGQYPQPGRVAVGRVTLGEDVDTIVAKFGVESFPALKLVKNGQIPPPKSKFREEYTNENILSFVRRALLNPIKKGKTFDNTTFVSKNTIVGFLRKNQPEYKTLRRVAMNLKDKCEFYAASRGPSTEPSIVFKPETDSEAEDVGFTGNATDFKELFSWASEKCTSLVTAITTKNLINSEYLPYLILYHHPDDRESVKKFKKIVREEIISEKDKIVFATATQDRTVYHPLRLDVIDKTLPVAVIDDCLKHMYTYPDADMFESGKLRQFVFDLYSGKLFREYYYGLDRDREL